MTGATDAINGPADVVIYVVFAMMGVEYLVSFSTWLRDKVKQWIAASAESEDEEYEEDEDDE